MPNSGDIQALMSAISTPRLSSYRKFFQPRTDEELLAIYRWNEDVCTTFSRKLKWVEVVLRNRFHSALSLRYGTVGAAASRDWYHHLKLSAHSRDSLRKITHNQRGVPRLQLQHDRLMALMHWLSPEVARMLRADPAHQQGERLLQAGTRLTYRQTCP